MFPIKSSLHNPRTYLLKTAAFAALFAVSAHAQQLRCDLIQSNATCFDIDTLQGRTITVPSNVTRLENEGIQLCQGGGPVGGDADIAYVYDNSGSMNSSHAYISGTDTTFYYGTGGCASTANSGTFTIQYWNPQGTATANRTITRLNSNTGCTNYSGDPYNARGRAYRLSLQNQATRAPTSMAGIMSFTSGTANVLTPRVLNPANLTTLLNGINAVSSGGTDYTSPLATSTTWLRTAAFTPQPPPARTKAIIFLSDGAPNNLNYLPLNATTPPIYGIFLGRDTAGTGRLRELSVLTGGAQNFFIVPPNRPDSLVSVIDAILGIILVQYNPSALTITNTTILPNQSSIGTLQQTTGGIPVQPIWRVTLANIIGLNTGLNAFTISHSYQEIRNNVVTTTVTNTTTFNISTTGPAATATTITPIPNAQGSTFATRCYAPSRIQWQTVAGVRPAFFTENDSTNVRLRLRTSASDSNDASFISNNSTRRFADWENSALTQTAHVADSTMFILNPVPMLVTAGPGGGNLVLEPFFTDSMIARWAHPRDTRDSARDTIPVFPYNRAADVWFASVSGGASVSFFNSSTTTVYVVVNDNRSRPGFVYRVTVSSDILGDNQIFNLTETSPGVFTATVPVSVSATPIGGDGRVQVSPSGDQLRVVYIDPVYNDQDVATAGFGISVQENPDLVFTDAVGNILPNPNTSFINPVNPYSLAAGSIYLRFRDDSITVPVNVAISTRSFRLGQQYSTDAETSLMTALPTTLTSRNWTTFLPLAESSLPGTLPTNGTVQGAYLIQITAVVTGHTNTGAPSINDTAILIVARPDQAATLSWAQQVNGVNPRGPVDIIDTLRDQDFLLSTVFDTVLATAYCPASGDSVAGWRFTQRSPGVYVSENLVRGAVPPVFTDRILACAAGDSVLVRYTDPVYGSSITQSIQEVRAPTANPTSGTGFPSTLDVTLSTITPGASINYTVNGTVPTVGQPLAYTVPVQLLATTTIEAVASAPNMLRSRVAAFTYTRSPLPSDLDILDANGNPVPVSLVTGRRTVTDAATALRMRLFTSQGGLGQASVAIRSATLGDDESSVLTDPPSITANGTIYAGPISLRGGATVPADLDDTLQTQLTDMIIATWTNPLNALDVVRDTVWIEPAFFSPQIRFSLTPGGPIITTFPVGTTTVYVVVESRFVPGNTYQIVVTTASDNETFTYPTTLTQIAPGIFSAAIPVNLLVPVSGNGSLQVLPAGDQITARFTDPIFNVTVTANAGYSTPAEISARIEFLDTNGVVLAAGAEYSPANGRVIVRYYDDYSASIAATVNPKKPLNFTLAATNQGTLIGTDNETDSMYYYAAFGYWERIFPLRDAVILAGNHIIESQFRGALTVSVRPHFNSGLPTSTDISANLIIAYPNQTPVPIITDPNGNPPGRTDTIVRVTVWDQPPTLVPGATITGPISCLNSGDVETVTLVYDLVLGAYVSSPDLLRNESPPNTVVLGDRILTCEITDRITFTYIEPVFPGPPTVVTATWTTLTNVSIVFVSTADTTVPITSTSDDTTNFTVIITTATITLNQRDSLAVIVRTPQGDLDTIWATETSATSGRFVAVIPFGFSLANPTIGNGTIDGRLNPAVPNNSVTANVVVRRTPVDSGVAFITLFSNFVPTTDGYVKDLNGDGRADAVYLVFAGPITLPTRIDSIFWNTHGLIFRAATTLQLQANGTVLYADLSANQFPGGLGMTGIPAGGNPMAILPSDASFGGARVPLRDSVGAVPFSAVKYPSDLTSNSAGVVKPDTIVITVTESIRRNISVSDWSRVFLFSYAANCSDPAAIQSAIPITVVNVIDTVGGTVFELEVGNALGSSNPLKGACIFLDPTGRILDLNGNKSGIMGVVLQGSNPNQLIRDFFALPPVVGYTNPNVSNPIDPRGLLPVQGTGAPIPGVTTSFVWVAPNISFPPGWQPGDPIDMPPLTGKPSDSVNNTIPYTPGRSYIPVGISVVQVVTTSRYFAHISLFDHLGHFVKSWDQKFGYNGELNNPAAQASNGVASFLFWDQHDYQRRKAGQGVYIWKVTFEFVNGSNQTRKETRIIRTGLMR